MPRFLELAVTSLCHLNCKYCYKKKSFFRPSLYDNPLSFKNGVAAVSYFLNKKDKAEKWITFLGGEPLLELSLIKRLVNYVKKNYPKTRVFFLLVTNGLLLNKDIISFIETNNIFIKVSAHCFNSKQFWPDNIKLRRNIERLVKYKNFAITIVVHKNTVHLYKQFKYLACSGIKRLYFNFDCLFSDYTVKSLNILQNELRRISNFVISRDKGKEIFISYLHTKKWRQLCQLSNMVLIEKPCFMDEYEQGNVYVMPNGDIFPCSIGTFTSSKSKYGLFKIGNIESATSIQIEENVIALKKRLARLRIKNHFCINDVVKSRKKKIEQILQEEYEHFNRAILGNTGN